MSDRFREIDPTSPRTLGRGDLQAVFEAGSLRWIGSAGTELVRGVYAATRDREWKTFPVRFISCRLRQGEDADEVRYEAVHESVVGEVAVTIGMEIGATGVVRCTFDGVVTRPFGRNRIGLCVLHPAELAGRPIETSTPWGRFRGHFPDLIAPLPPFGNLTAVLQDPGGPREARIDFEGDLFEMEDQRNWSDASFKTFSTPLSLAAPVEVERGTTIHQAITITVPRRGRTGRRVGAGSVRVSPSGPQWAPIPALGTSAPYDALSDNELAALRPVPLRHLRVTREAGGPLGGRHLTSLREAARVGWPVELAVVVDRERDVTDGLDEALAAPVAISRLLVFDSTTFETPSRLLNGAVRALAARGLNSIPVGGGTRFDFADLNGRPISRELDVLSYRVVPQIHAFDDETILENVDAIGDTVLSARALARGVPIALTPVALAQDRDPNVRREAATTDGPPVDARFQGLLGAVWTVGVLREAVAAGVESVTIAEAAGPGGFVSADGMHTPALAALAEVARATVASCPSVEPANAVFSIGLRQAGGMFLLVANRSRDAVRVHVPEHTVAIDGLRAGGRWEPFETIAADVELPVRGIVRFALGGATDPTIAPSA